MQRDTTHKCEVMETHTCEVMATHIDKEGIGQIRSGDLPMKTAACYHWGKKLFSSGGRVDGLDSKSYVPAFSSPPPSLP